MNWLITGAALGVGLAMDAFSVSVVNGLREPGMKTGKAMRIAGVFGFFQTAMPMIGWLLVRTVIEMFRTLEPVIPWIGCGLLVLIGGKMLLEGLGKKKEETPEAEIGTGSLVTQGIATSIDALSAGLAMAEETAAAAAAEAAVIGVVTFAICMAGVKVGNKVGEKIAGKASAVGGLILIGIGISMVLRAGG